MRGYIFFIQKALNSFAFAFTTRYGNMIILVKLLPKLVFSCWEAFLKRYCGSFVLSSTPNKFKMKYTGVSVCWTVNVSLMGTSLCTEYPRLCKCSDLSCKPPISQTLSLSSQYGLVDLFWFDTNYDLKQLHSFLPIFTTWVNILEHIYHRFITQINAFWL